MARFSGRRTRLPQLFGDNLKLWQLTTLPIVSPPSGFLFCSCLNGKQPHVGVLSCNDIQFTTTTQLQNIAYKKTWSSKTPPFDCICILHSIQSVQPSPTAVPKKKEGSASFSIITIPQSIPFISHHTANIHLTGLFSIASKSSTANLQL